MTIGFLSRGTALGIALVLSIPVFKFSLRMAAPALMQAYTYDVAVGIIDVKSYFIEPVDILAERIRECLEHAPADRLVFAPDCGLSQTARWAARRKLHHMVEAVHAVRGKL